MTENPENNPPKAFTLNTSKGKNKTIARTAFNTTNATSSINESMTNAIVRRVHRFWSALLARTTSNLRCIVSLHSYTRELKSVFVDAAPPVIRLFSEPLHIAALKREHHAGEVRCFLRLLPSRSNGQLQHYYLRNPALNSRDAWHQLKRRDRARN